MPEHIKMNKKPTAQQQTGESTASRKEDMTDGYWNQNTLVSFSDFSDIGYGIRTNYFEKCDLENDEASYFCAVNGECFALICSTGHSCIAEVEKALSHAMRGPRYVTFALKSKTPSAIRAWRAKWSKRTSGNIDRFDASVGN
jgi:hypothetical protein